MIPALVVLALVLVATFVLRRRRRLPFAWMRELAGAGFRPVVEPDGRRAMVGGAPEVKVAWSTTSMAPLLRVRVPLVRALGPPFHAALGGSTGRAIGRWAVVGTAGPALERLLASPTLEAWARAHRGATAVILEDAVLYGVDDHASRSALEAAIAEARTFAAVVEHASA